jgi:two-component system phosphate regulon sensor histidine kinase PhoR
MATKGQHQIHSEIDPDLWLKGTPEELQSIVSNLLFNAIQHTPDGSEIWIRWQHGSSGPLLSVEDSGDGIEERHIPRLTERFYRVDNARSRETGGTGLGLAIVKQVMLRYGGELSIKSKPGVGTTFSCSFPQSLQLHPDQGVTD